jgi:uncharacterized protein YutE (UPF0331/DUF86 family)
MSVAQAIRSLEKAAVLPAATAGRLDQIRRFRNRAVHGKEPVSSRRLTEALGELAELRSAVQPRRQKGHPSR